MKKSKIFVFSGLIALAMIFSVLFGFNTNNIKSVYASSTPEIVSVELGLDDKVPTIGEKIFYPEIVSVNGDPALKDLVKFPTYNHVYQEWSKGAIDITDDNYVFEEGEKYTYYVQLVKTAGGLLDKDVVVTFAGFNSREKDEDSIAFFFDIGYLGPEYAINVGEGVIAKNKDGEIITKAHKNELVFFDVEAPAGKGLHSVSITPQNENFIFDDSTFRLTQMPAQAVTVSAEYGDAIDEIRLTSQNFEIGANAEDFSVTTTQDAKFSVEMAMLFDVAEEDVASGEFTTGVYMLSVLIKVDEGYGFNIPLYANDETGYNYTKAISLDGWGPATFAIMDSRAMEEVGIENHRGYFGVNFYLNLSDISCTLDGDIKMKGYEYGKTIEDVTFTGSVAGGEKTDITSYVTYGFVDEISNYANAFSENHAFVLGDSYVVSIIISNSPFNISKCEPDYFTLNGIKPAHVLKVTDNTNGYIILSYELPAVEYPKFDVIFNANGGTGTMEDAKALGGYELPACTFTAPTGKQFKGWALTNNGEVITTATYNVTEPITLYAIWEDVTITNYLIRFNANGASGNMPNVQANGEYTLPTCTFTAPKGKQFKGWALTSDGEVIEGTTINITGDITLHAIWEDVEPQQPPVSPEENNGLGVGAIIGIVLASLVVVGTGGFAIFWFVVKKKSFADLGKAFKSLWAKIKNLFNKKSN